MKAHKRWAKTCRLGALLCTTILGFSGCEPSVRTVYRTSDQAQLAKFAIEAKNPAVREAAILKLTDQTLLARVAREDGESYVRAAAVRNLTDQAALLQLATEARESHIRKAAVNNLADQAALAKIAAEDEEPLIREAAVNNLDDQALLAGIVMATVFMEAKDSITSKAAQMAVEKLTGQAVLAKIAIEHKNYFVAITATARLTDEMLLVKVALSPNDQIGERAVRKLTNQALLAKVAIESVNHRNIREQAVMQLTDPAQLARVAIETRDIKDFGAGIGEQAASKLTSQALLARVALETEDAKARKAAMEKLTDQALLFQVAMEAGDEYLRKTAGEKLTDQALLLRAAMEAGDADLGAAAAGKLTDQALLPKVALESKNHAAVSRAWFKMSAEERSGLAEAKGEAAGAPPHQRAADLRMISHAIATIPDEHKERLCQKLLEILEAFENPAIRAELGEVQSLQVLWTHEQQGYSLYGLPSDSPKMVYGEKVSMMCKLGKTPSTSPPIQTHTYWKTEFPREVTPKTSWIPAEISLEKPLASIADFLPKSMPAQWIGDRSWFLRKEAAMKLTDQAALVKAAVEDKDSRVRRTAAERLTDQAALAGVALMDKDTDVRRAAIQKLTDQAALVRVALENKNFWLCHAAVGRLVDQEALAKVAAESQDAMIRQAAAKRQKELHPQTPAPSDR